MSYTPATTRTHDALVQALTCMEGQELTTAEIRQLVEVRVPQLGKDLQWLHPTDHCDNHTVKGACACSGTEQALLTRLGRGSFRVRDIGTPASTSEHE